MTVGIIGLGVVGQGMAARLAAGSTPMPIASTVMDVMHVARARGFGDQDYPAVIQVLELLADCAPLSVTEEGPA